jgi:hypothetical protein
MFTTFVSFVPAPVVKTRRTRPAPLTADLVKLAARIHDMRADHTWKEIAEELGFANTDDAGKLWRRAGYSKRDN